MAVDLNIEGAVARISLNSPENRNALSRLLLSELMAAFDEAEANPEVRAILIDSAIGVFCSGADLKEALAGESSAMVLVDLQRRIAALPKPVVVKVAGPVRAGGLGILGAADLVFAAESVTFSLTEVRLGLAPAVISLSLKERMLPRAVSDAFLTGRVFSADEAEEMGLITAEVNDDELDAAVAKILAELVKGTLQGLAESKALANVELLARIDAEGAALAELSERLFSSEEAIAAMTKFFTRPKSDN